MDVMSKQPIVPVWKAPLFLRTPYEGFYIELRFGNLLVDVHASVEDEQDPGGILMQGVEDIVSALKISRRMPRAACQIWPISGFSPIASRMNRSMSR